MIPQTIHQIFIADAGASLDPDTVGNMAAWQAFHPGYKYKLWGLAEIRALAESFDPRILAAIDVCAFPAMKADIARLLILLLEGGTYVDLKLRPMRAFLDEFRSHRLVLVEQFKTGEFERRQLINGFIAATPGQEFLARVLRECVTNVEARIDVGVWSTTGAGVMLQVQGEYFGEYGEFRDGVGVVMRDEAWGGLLGISSGKYNNDGRHWHDRERSGESLYTDCEVQPFWIMPELPWCEFCYLRDPRVLGEKVIGEIRLRPRVETGEQCIIEVGDDNCWYPICAEHIAILDQPGMEHWEFRPLAPADT